jgi:thiol-disulfide isomerase/thioredoxin
MSTEPAPPARLPRSTLVTWLGLIVLGLAFMGFLTLSNNPRRDYVGKDHPGVGRRLPSVQLVPLVGDAEPLSLESLEGSVVLMNLWGTWCGPCRREFPRLMKLEERLRGEPDFKFVSVSCGQENPEPMTDLRRRTEAYVTEMGAPFPIYADPHWATRKAAFATSYDFGGTMPTTVALDRAGKVRGIWTGYADGDERVMEELIRELLVEPREAGPS